MRLCVIRRTVSYNYFLLTFPFSGIAGIIWFAMFDVEIDQWNLLSMYMKLWNFISEQIIPAVGDWQNRGGSQ